MLTDTCLSLGPEVVDKAIIGCTRIENHKISCVDFVKPSNNRPGDPPRVIFRTHMLKEKRARKLIFQVGTASPTLAVEAARIVAGDVAGIGVNAGCPKHFSIHSGMGAALLQTPDILCEILTNLVKAVGPGTEFNIPISVKIRLLEPHEKTFGLVESIVKTGINHLTVHMRTTPMRPRDPAISDPDIIRGVVKICRMAEAGVEIAINGDIAHRADAEKLSLQYDLDGCMIARAAEENPSCFAIIRGNDQLKPWLEIAREYVTTAMEVDNHFSNTKYVLGQVMDGKSELFRQITGAKTYRDICTALGIELRLGLSSGCEVVNTGKKTGAVEKAMNGCSESVVAAGRGVSKRERKKRSERGVTGQSGTRLEPGKTQVPTVW